MSFAFKVIFSMDNGRGNVTTKYTPPTKNQLCDGQWHTIRGKCVGLILLSDLPLLLLKDEAKGANANLYLIINICFLVISVA